MGFFFTTFTPKVIITVDILSISLARNICLSLSDDIFATNLSSIKDYSIILVVVIRNSGESSRKRRGKLGREEENIK